MVRAGESTHSPSSLSPLFWHPYQARHNPWVARAGGVGTPGAWPRSVAVLYTVISPQGGLVKKKTKKLVLNKETLNPMTRHLNQVAGGNETEFSGCFGSLGCPPPNCPSAPYQSCLRDE